MISEACKENSEMRKEEARTRKAKEQIRKISKMCLANILKLIMLTQKLKVVRPDALTAQIQEPEVEAAVLLVHSLETLR